MKKQRSVKKNIVLLAAAFFSGTFICKNTSLFSGMSFKTEKSSFRKKFSIMSLEFK